MRQETLARACMLDHPATAYIVPVRGPDGPAEYEVTWDELARDAAWTQDRLRGLGLAEGHRALVSFSGYEGAWFQPVIEALRNMGVVYGTSESMGWDHVRTRVFHRELDLHAVLGISLETLEALSGQAMIGDLFRDTPVLLGRPDAARRLRDAGVPAGIMTPLGPALAVECRERDGAHVNRAEWTVRERDGGLGVAAASAERAKGTGEIVLDTAGSVRTERCACGSDDPRVIFG
ncbi:hypothetical protein GCM10010191_18090 [Actinomadura vinacea]|uniref:AMP-dependent synthetase/ligase domain-containing protein n=1 Tax=Actinomadura vinacea TaxID=115336 RepID=A0ABN3IQB7_9ACTN